MRGGLYANLYSIMLFLPDMQFDSPRWDQRSLENPCRTALQARKHICTQFVCRNSAYRWFLILHAGTHLILALKESINIFQLYFYKWCIHYMIKMSYNGIHNKNLISNENQLLKKAPF